jgi:peptidyl-prolyl cis-trans isomerase C
MISATRTFILLCILAISAKAFVVQPGSMSRSNTALGMGMFDGISKAFSNAEYASTPEGVKATARHILVKDKAQIDLIINEIESGVTFNKVAQAFSTCPSASSGGSLGSFPPGELLQGRDLFNELHHTKLASIHSTVGSTGVRIIEAPRHTSRCHISAYIQI